MGTLTTTRKDVEDTLKALLGGVFQGQTLDNVVSDIMTKVDGYVERERTFEALHHAELSVERAAQITASVRDSRTSD